MKADRAGNYRCTAGVYSTMRRGAAFIFFCCAGFGQAHQDDLLTEKLAAISRSREEGRFSDAVKLREDARRLLDTAPADAPQFGFLAQAVAQAYSEGGRTAQARAVLQAALERTGSLGVTSAARVQLLTAMATSWRADQNLLKAAECLEKAIAALESAGADLAFPRPSSFNGPVRLRHFTSMRVSSEASQLNGLYSQLAELQQQLGRPDAVAACNAKLRALAAKSGDRELAQQLEREGRLSEAAAIYQRAAEQAATPREASELRQSVADVWVRSERYDEAIAAQRQAIAGMEALGEARENADGARQTLAQILHQAGRTEQADAVYTEMLAAGGAERQVPLLAMYANFLSSSNRGAQALALLTTFRASQLGLEPMEDFRLLSAMANAARGLGDNEQAAKYDAELQAKQREEMPDLLVVPVMDDLFGKAEAAASEGRIAEALGLAMQGLTAAGSAENREPVGWQIPAITSAMTAKGGNAAVEQLYAQALLAAESWVDDSLVPLLNLEQSRAGGLIQDPLRRGEARLWIDRYRELLVAARGSDSGTLAEPMRMSLQLEQARPAPVSAVPALDLVAFEEGVNGGTSEPFLEALGALAETYQMNQEWDRVAGVRRRMVQIGDLAYEDGDVRRGQTRAELAMALAQMGRFDEAEQMALEAIAAGRGVRRTPGASFEGMLQQIRQMRAAGRRK